MVDYMRPKRYIFAGWAVAVAAIFGASQAFPAIADKAAEQREAARWQARAEAFQGVELTEETLAHVSSHAKSLTAFHTDSDIANSLMRDVVMTQDLMGVGGAQLKTAKFNVQEHRCLSEALYYEARSEGNSGLQAVAEVVQNRVRSKHYPDTICGVVYQGAERNTGCQFSFTCDGSTLIEPRGRYWGTSQEIASIALMNGYAPITDRATHYHTVDVNPHWAPQLRYNKTIGTHKFYRFKFRERRVKGAALRLAPPT